MVETVKMIVFFLSKDPSGQFMSWANNGRTPQKSMRSRDEMNFEAIKIIIRMINSWQIDKISQKKLSLNQTLFTCEIESIIVSIYLANYSEKIKMHME